MASVSVFKSGSSDTCVCLKFYRNLIHCRVRAVELVLVKRGRGGEQTGTGGPCGVGMRECKSVRPVRLLRVWISEGLTQGLLIEKLLVGGLGVSMSVVT